MPNILAHSHITSDVKGPRLYDLVLGSVLPDFQGMYMATDKVRVPIRHDGDIILGVDFHQETDNIFDQLPQNSQINGPLFQELLTTGINERTAKFTAAFAGHLLLDAALLDHDQAMSNYRQLRGNILENRTSLARLYAKPFASYVIKFFEQNRVVNYADPAKIAIIAQRRLESRSKSTERYIVNEQLPGVARVFGEHYERVGSLGITAVDKTIEILKA